MVGNILFISKSASVILSWGNLNSVIYENPLEAEEDLLVQIIAHESILNIPGVFEGMRQSVVRRCIAYSEVVGHHFQQLL